MRVNVDSQIVSDPRFKKLARRCGCNWREAIGSCLLVWFVCYERRSALLSAEDIDIAAEIDGFAAHMIDVGLAHSAENLVLVHGVDQRIRFLNEQSKRGRRGGKRRHDQELQANARNGSSERLTESKRTLADAPSERLKSAQAYSPSPDLTLAPDPDLTLAPDQRVVRDKRAPRVAAGAADKLDGYQQTIDVFHKRYGAAYNGAKPTWGGKQGAMLKRLLAAHGAAEVQRRIAVLFDAPPSWLTGPYDLATLAQHFDKLVGSNGGHAPGVVGRFDPSMNPKDEDNETPPWDL